MSSAHRRQGQFLQNQSNTVYVKCTSHEIMQEHFDGILHVSKRNVIQHKIYNMACLGNSVILISVPFIVPMQVAPKYS